MTFRTSGHVVLCLLPVAVSLARPVHAQPRSPADYAAAEQRLAELYSLDRVAKERIEVRWDDLQGMATPLSYRVPIQACHHPDMVFLQPDLSIALGREPDALGLGFAAGAPAQLPDMWKVTRGLRDGCLPIVESRWSVGPVEIVQTAFAILPGDAEVVTGKETQYVIVRMAVANKDTSPLQVPLYAMIGKMDGSQNVMYAPFLAPVSRWQTAPPGCGAAGRGPDDRRPDAARLSLQRSDGGHVPRDARQRAAECGIARSAHQLPPVRPAAQSGRDADR